MNSQKKNTYITFVVSILFQILLFCLSNDLFHGGVGNDDDDDNYLPSPLKLQRSDDNNTDLPTFNVGLQRQDATRPEYNEPTATEQDFENLLRTITDNELKRLQRAIENESDRRTIS